jgi:heme oxygenase
MMPLPNTPELAAAKKARQIARLRNETERIDMLQADQLVVMQNDWSNRVEQKYMTQAAMDKQMQELRAYMAARRSEQIAHFCARYGIDPKLAD